MGIDTSPFIYAAEDHPTYSVPSAYVLRWIATGQYAIQIATAMAGLATGFITNDRAFQRVTEVEVLLLDELV